MIGRETKGTPGVSPDSGPVKRSPRPQQKAKLMQLREQDSEKRTDGVSPRRV